MPYIKNKARRIHLDKIINEMVKQEVIADGDLNYILFKFAKYHIDHRYNTLKNYCAELNECAEEIRRRFIVPREKQAMAENGDI